MNNRLILFGLHQLEGIGWKTILKLTTHLPELKAIFTLTVEQIKELNVKTQQAEILSSRLTPDFIMKKMQTYEQANIGFVTICDESYPDLLKETAQPPWVLYFKGDTTLLKWPLLGMVGTRTPTVYGKKVADELSCALAHAGFCIVSGLARGIDSSAHAGAIKGGGKTIAILGCSIDQVYPPENAFLYREIESKGLIVSEYPIGVPLHPGMFPYRNRIIAGMALGLVVVEAAHKSGSLITVDQALEESRDVFAVPGPITSPKSKGVLDLIKQGSKIVTSAEDIIEEYQMVLKQGVRDSNSTVDKVWELSGDESKVYELLSADPTTIDELVELSQFTFGHLHSVLLSLLMKKQIVQLPGFTYIAI
jgi:DNA processing protein